MSGLVAINTHDVDRILKEERRKARSEFKKLLIGRGASTPVDISDDRRRKLTQEKEAQVIERLRFGESQSQIARDTGVSQSLISRIKIREGIGPGNKKLYWSPHDLMTWKGYFKSDKGFLHRITTVTPEKVWFDHSWYVEIRRFYKDYVAVDAKGKEYPLANKIRTGK